MGGGDLQGLYTFTTAITPRDKRATSSHGCIETPDATKKMLPLIQIDNTDNAKPVNYIDTDKNFKFLQTEDRPLEVTNPTPAILLIPQDMRIYISINVQTESSLRYPITQSITESMSAIKVRGDQKSDL